MKRVALGMAAVLGIAIGVHSFVYACDHSTRAEAPAALAVTPSVTVDVAVPLDHMRVHRVSMVCTRSATDETRATPSQTVRRTAKVAATLGRALVTTVGAVVDSLVDAAVDATASLV